MSVGPDLTQLLGFVRSVFGLTPHAAALAPGRAHAEATVYRVDCDEGPHFLKLSPAPPGNLRLARCLADSGISSVLAPLPSRDGQLAVRIGAAWATLYPFADGENGFQRPLSERQWTALGATLKAIHSAGLPRLVRETMRVEAYAETFRRKVRALLAPGALPPPADDAARRLIELLSEKRGQIVSLVEHAEQLATSVSQKGLPLVPCHGDLHAGNVLVGGAGSVFIVDWDDPVLAPKERDLMFIGAGIGGAWNRPEESAAFYRGYGTAAVDAETIAYYRCDRFVEDVAVFCDRLLLHPEDAVTDRALAVQKVVDAFGPNDVVEIAERTYAAL